MVLKKLYIDFETYFDSKKGYTLKEISITEYIRDSRFKVFGCGYYYEGEYGWIRGEDMDSFKELPWHEIEMIAHYVKFDGAIFAWKYGIQPARYFDTQSLSRAILGQNMASHSLRAVSEYLGLPPKGELKSDGILGLSPQQEQEMMVYNQRDLECCAGIDQKLRNQFPSNQLDPLDWTIRAFVNPILELDIPCLEYMVQKEHKRKNEIFKKLGIEKEAFSSNKKFSDLLEKSKVEVPTKESPRTAGKRIPAFSLQDPGFVALKKICPDLYEARVAAKSTITETRGHNLIDIGRTGPFPFDVQFSGAIGTHRYSGGSGAGGNPQNFPTKGEMRKSVIPPSGSMLVVGDFSAIEARLVAWLAKEPSLIADFLQGSDVYSGFASMIYGHPVNKKEHPTERKVGKTCILGLGYNMGADKFQTRIKLDAGIELPYRVRPEGGFDNYEARRIVNLYRSVYSNIPLLWNNAAMLIPQMLEGYTQYIPFAPFLKLERNAIVLPSGLRIQYPNLRRQTETYEWIYDVYKRRYVSEGVKLYGGKIIENICQALAGEICKLAITRAEEAGLRVVGQVHDEILAICGEKDGDRVSTILKQSMEFSPSFWPELKLEAEVKVGKSWAEAKE